MLKKVCAGLKEAAKHKRGKEEGRALAEAAALLEEEGKLMELLNTYRNILHQA